MRRLLALCLQFKARRERAGLRAAILSVVVLLGPIRSFAPGINIDDFIDRLDETLTVSAFDDAVRARLSGTLELEAYHFSLPAPGLIDSQRHTLLNPRVTLFLDAQAGSKFYFFAQARADRGFDPSDGVTEVRLDEYALRFTPWEDGRLSLQLGKFATVIGRWNVRHLAWDNPFINAPFPYENVMPVADMEPAASAREFVSTPITTRSKYEYLPLVWNSAYTSGVSVAGKIGRFDFAAELKNAAPSSRPEAWDLSVVGFDHPTVSGRIGYRPNQAWNLGVSASRGPYLHPEAEIALPLGRGLGDYQQLMLAQDVSFEWHHLQVWAEFFQARFEVPHVGNADTFAYFLEAKYKFTPQLFGALRWNQQFFAKVPEGDGGRTAWADDAWRIDAAIGYRFTPHTQLKLQYDLGYNDSGRSGFGHMVAAQLMVRF